jgi:hypothetical protein
MSEFLIGVITGVIATIIGFVLTMIWDVYKNGRESKNRQEAVLSAGKGEYDYNLETMKFNMDLLKHEIEVIDQKRVIVEPLMQLQNSFWDLIKIQIPKNLTNGEILRKIRYVAQQINQINETLRSREDYRVNNQAMSNFHIRLKSYDELLIKFMNNLGPSIIELKDVIK